MESATYPRLADSECDLQTVLDAWNTATERLQHTHELLRGEVKRLTDELAEKNAELARQSRLADLGLMAAHVAHEVRNALVPIKLYLSVLKRHVAADDRATELLGKTRDGFSVLENVVNDLLQFTSQREPQLSRFNILELCEEIADGLAPRLESLAVELVLDFADEQLLTADRDMLRRAIFNLMLNALDVLPERGRLKLSGAARDDGYLIRLSDNGPGLPAEVRDRLFEPFFTTKSHGTGLGLAIVERIAAAHAGQVWADDSELGGATFSLLIPSSASAQESWRNAA